MSIPFYKWFTNVEILITLHWIAVRSWYCLFMWFLLGKKRDLLMIILFPWASFIIFKNLLARSCCLPLGCFYLCGRAVYWLSLQYFFASSIFDTEGEAWMLKHTQRGRLRVEGRFDGQRANAEFAYQITWQKNYSCIRRCGREFRLRVTGFCTDSALQRDFNSPYQRELVGE